MALTGISGITGLSTSLMPVAAPSSSVSWTADFPALQTSLIPSLNAALASCTSPLDVYSALNTACGWLDASYGYVDLLTNGWTALRGNDPSYTGFSSGPTKNTNNIKLHNSSTNRWRWDVMLPKWALLIGQWAGVEQVNAYVLASTGTGSTTLVPNTPGAAVDQSISLYKGITYPNNTPYMPVEYFTINNVPVVANSISTRAAYPNYTDVLIARPLQGTGMAYFTIGSDWSSTTSRRSYGTTIYGILLLNAWPSAALRTDLQTFFTSYYNLIY